MNLKHTDNQKNCGLHYSILFKTDPHEIKMQTEKS